MQLRPQQQARPESSQWIVSCAKILAFAALSWKVLDVVRLLVVITSSDSGPHSFDLTRAEQLVTQLATAGGASKAGGEGNTSCTDIKEDSNLNAKTTRSTAAVAREKELPRDFSIYLPSIPHPDEWPSPLDRPAYQYLDDDDDNINADSKITITTCIPVMTRQVDIETNLPKVLQSVQRQTLLADEVAIVISDVDRLRKNWRKKGGEGGWCAFMMDFFRAYIPDIAKLRVACVGGRLTAGWARNVLARLASGTIFSFVDADDEEYSVRNEVIQNMFGCYRGQLNLLLHGSSKDRHMHHYELAKRYKGEEKGVPRYGVRPGDRCADDELVAKTRDGKWANTLTPLMVTYGDTLFDRIWITFDTWGLGGFGSGVVTHGHMIVHRRVFRHVQFTVLAKGEDAMFARDVIMTYGKNRNATIFLNRPLTWYRKEGKANKDLLLASNGENATGTTK